MRAVSNTHSDPTEDLRGSWKSGYPVVVKPDGHVWGSAEGLPTFWIIKVPALSVDKAQQFIGRWYENDNVTPHGRSLWSWDVANIPSNILTKLNSVGSITIGSGGDLTWNSARQLLKNLKTGVSAPANP